ncbi:protein FAM179B-like, partial [Asbolus verrucosus]
TQKNENINQKSIFSYNVYRTNNEQRPSVPTTTNFKSTSASSALWNDPEVLYVNEKVLKRRTRRKGILRESSTQTSKTILQLAQLEAGYMSPDSLTASPRDCGNYSMANCPYSVSNRLSDYTLEGSCHEQDCLFNTKRRERTPPKFFDKPLTQTFLERNRNKILAKRFDAITCYKRESRSDPHTMKSRSFVGSYDHPNYIQEPMEVKRRPMGSPKVRFHRKSSKSLDLPDNSFVRRKSSSVCYVPQNTFMCPTAASQIKSKMAEIQGTNSLIPAMRRGRSTSPKPSIDRRRFDISRKIPYIDQSKSDVSSSTTLINTNRIPDRVKLRNLFDEDLLKVDDISLKMSDDRLSLVSNLDPSNSSIDNTICAAVSRLREPDWRIALRGLAEIVEICRLVDVDLVYDYMSSINQRLIELLKSPRSHVCRTACQAAGHLFEYIKDTRRPEFDDIVDLLLHKTADANKFIRQDANLALDCMVTHISPFNAVRALCSKGPFHKNPLVRTATVRLLVCVIVIAGADFILNPNNNEYTRKRIILNLARFLEDKNLETRKLAERLYKVLCKEPRFDIYLKKYLEKDQILKIKKTLRIIHKK